MKNILLILMLIFLACKGNAQSNYIAQNIDNTNIRISDSSKCIVIYYKSGGCSLCMKVLVSYCKYVSEIYTNTAWVIMMHGYSYEISEMRSNTTYIQNVFGDITHKIVYDIDDNKRKTFEKKYKISYYPSLLLLNTKKNKLQYIPYKKLFQLSENIEISEYAKSKIHDFLEDKK
ncbi:MAG TPA: hypothetical protein PLW70_02655 [Bacteroidales bacterium]|nr:hypothetical protein [Bacteroidales bacterium]HQB19492.1 hypothetical protein [Bacteroidales bacterium]